MAANEEPVYIDEHHQRITEFAHDYCDEDEVDDFIDGLMERRGYTRVQSWGPPEGDPEDDGRKPVLKKRAPGGQQQRAAASQGPRRGAYFRR